MSKSESHFSKQASLYYKYRPEYPKELYSFIFEHLDQQELAWDCATGSGQVASFLADHFKHVFANDISKEQLSYAPEKANTTYLNTKAKHSGLPNNTFNLVTIAQAIHWLDFEQFYNEVRRTARPKALLAVFGYGMIRISEAVNPIIDELYEEAFGSFFNENRTFLDKRYQTIPFPFEEIPSPDFESTYRWSLDHLEGYFNSWSAVQKMKTELSVNPVDPTMRKLRDKLGNQEKIDVSFPMFMRLGKVTG